MEARKARATVSIDPEVARVLSRMNVRGSGAFGPQEMPDRNACHQRFSSLLKGISSVTNTLAVTLQSFQPTPDTSIHGVFLFVRALTEMVDPFQPKSVSWLGNTSRRASFVRDVLFEELPWTLCRFTGSFFGRIFLQLRLLKLLVKNV